MKHRTSPARAHHDLGRQENALCESLADVLEALLRDELRTTGERRGFSASGQSSSRA
ncbi:MAG TPA: hypothetical protein VGI39_46425 [Polyangiaceae bacterium]